MNSMRYRVVTFMAAIACATVFGCRENPAPPPGPPDPSVPALTSDEKILLSLDYFDPMYKVDANGRVTHLRLTGRHVPPAVLAEVGKLTELHGLDLYGATVTDEGLAQLKDLQKLRSLGMGATSITDKGLAHLEKLQSLQWVWVPRQTVSKAAIDKLKDERPDMNIYLQ